MSRLIKELRDRRFIRLFSILRLVADKPMTTRQVAKYFTCHERSVFRDIRVLKLSGWIKITSRKKTFVNGQAKYSKLWGFIGIQEAVDTDLYPVNKGT